MRKRIIKIIFLITLFFILGQSIASYISFEITELNIIRKEKSKIVKESKGQFSFEIDSPDIFFAQDDSGYWYQMKKDIYDDLLLGKVKVKIIEKNNQFYIVRIYE